MSETKNPDYAKGKIVVGSMGWSSYSVVDPSLTQVCRKGTMIMMIMNMLMMGWCSFVIADPSSTQYEDDNIMVMRFYKFLAVTNGYYTLFRT